MTSRVNFLRLRLILGLLIACWGTASAAQAHAAPGTTYTRDTAGRIATVTSAEGTTSYSYFHDGEISEVVYPNGARDVFDHEEIVAAHALVDRLVNEDLEGQALRTARNLSPAAAPAARKAPGTGAVDASANRFGFTGYVFDRETGLYWSGSRYYDPATARFTTQDSHLGKQDDPDSQNRFAYAKNNPLRYVDPTGHETASAGCYWGPTSCGSQRATITNPEKRSAGSVVGTLKWAAKTAWGTLQLALGRGWDGFGERVVEAGRDPGQAVSRAGDAVSRHVNEQLDRAQERIAKGDQIDAASEFTERVTAPGAAVALGTGELAVGAVRTGARLLARPTVPVADVPPPIAEGIPPSATMGTTVPFSSTENGRLVPSVSGGSQGADALLERTSNSGWSRSGVFSDQPVEWKATRPKGTGQIYEVYQRTDIEWDRVRTSGDKRFIGKTNAEAAKAGLAPQLSDDSFATLHHVGQNGEGPLAEASTGYHGVGKSGQQALHSQYGTNEPHPTNPVDRRAFGVDTREYWQWRVSQESQ